MSHVASSISGAAYVMASAEDKDNANGFEFTRRKRWPQLLLQELVGSALFCLKPLPDTQPTTTPAASSDGENAQQQLWRWKIIFASPSIADMIGQRPADVEGRDFFDLVYVADQPQLQAMFQNLATPGLSSHNSSASSSVVSSVPGTPINTHTTTSSKSQTTYIRMITDSDHTPLSARHGSYPKAQTVIWEIRAHATGAEASDVPTSFGLGGAGTLVPETQNDESGIKGKAIWVMGRTISDGSAVGDGNSQSLDAFLEIKLENEKLRAELRDLKGDLDDEEYTSRAPYNDQPPLHHPGAPGSEASSHSLPSSSPESSPALFPAPARTKVGRPPKDNDSRDKKKSKKAPVSMANPRASNGGGEGEGMHVCVTCGRTDSPEWRKGPLGPKTLCNACGLRWAKRNSTAPGRKDKRAGNKA